MRDLTDNEVGGFGITDPDDLLLITDFVLVKQKVTPVSIAFDDESVANYFEDQVEAGRVPGQFARIWLHTHPGSSPEPSSIDESTFERVFGNCDWSVMAIVAQTDDTYARLHFNSGPGGEVRLSVQVDYNAEFKAADFDEWEAQYRADVIEDNILTEKSQKRNPLRESDLFGSDESEYVNSLTCQELLMAIDSMAHVEREYFLDELSMRSSYWQDDESEVFYE